ncbi:MAG: glycosyltransferase [Proteobacteria bacterium]|nr:MAG: glycosyltransferase [Pseudomonadota bacterium]
MKILFLSQIVPYPPHGGVLQRGFNIVREIARNHELHLMAFLHRDILRTDVEIEYSRQVLGGFCHSVEYFDLWPKRSRLDRLAAIGAGLALPEPFSVIAHRSPEFARRIGEMRNERDIDVIHYDTIALARFRRAAPDFASVLTHHNIESQLMARRAAVERWPACAYLGMQTRKLIAYEAAMSPCFDVNIMMSGLDEQALSKIAPGVETTVVPNGVDVEYFTPRTESPEAAMIYTGGMNMFANRDAVMYFVDRIWPLIKQARPDARFDIVGQDPPQELLAKARKDSGLHIHGYVEDIRPLVGKAAVYVVPIRVGGGTRLKVLDALAQGKAIVSTSVGCEGIRITGGHDIELADDADAFAARVVALLNDPPRRQELGNNARHLAESYYAWGPIVKRLETAYEHAISKRKGRREKVE